MAGLGIDNGFPRLVPSRAHAVIDYIHAATNFVAAAMFWKRNRAAAAAALGLGVGVLGNALMTDYELGVFRLYSFKVHGALDYGVAAASAVVPAVLALPERSAEAMFFYAQGGGEFMAAGMTNYDDDSGAKNFHRDFTLLNGGRAA